MGYTLLQRILYADFSGLSQEAAVIPISDNAQAENSGFLIYAATDKTPMFVAILRGFNMLAKMDAGQLVVTQDLVDWTSPLDPPESRISGHIETRYRLQDNRLVVVAQTSQGEPNYRPIAVEHFYNFLKFKEFQDAYAMLSPAFQSTHPYDRWVAGYADTVSASIHMSDTSNGLIAIEISSTVKTPTGHKPRSFQGTWSLTWNPSTSRWLLDQANIANVPLTGPRAWDWTQILATEPNFLRLAASQ